MVEFGDVLVIGVGDGFVYGKFRSGFFRRVFIKLGDGRDGIECGGGGWIFGDVCVGVCDECEGDLRIWFGI